ncbi:MAG: DUF3987 domain-containing protein [Proteobacteria bacterium]|nr:DUF3987 domain-containing protein [Pseudomonadota bacterium]
MALSIEKPRNGLQTVRGLQQKSHYENNNSVSRDRQFISDMPKDVEVLTGDSLRFCSGVGQFHSENHPTNPKKYLTTTIDDIVAMVRKPPSVAKSEALWGIFSIELSRAHKIQRKHGQFGGAWLDIDENPNTFQHVVDTIKALLPGIKFLAYLTKSATLDNQKCRIIFPYDELCPGQDHVLVSKILNDLLEQAGITPDRKTEAAGQICYLPNRGEHYEYHIEPGDLLDWESHFSKEIAAEKERIKAAEIALRERRELARQRAMERMASGTASPIDAYNDAFQVEDCLLAYGYKQHGQRYLSPNSSSGSAGVSVKDGKWISSHESDRETVGTFGDAFDLFTFYEHNGNRTAALKEAGEMFSVNGVTLTKASQQTYMATNGGELLWAEGHTKQITPERPEPLPLPDELLPVAAFDFDLLPENLREWAKDISDRLQCPPDFVAVGIMTTLAAVIGRKVGIRPQEHTGWTVVSNLWTLIIGRPGILKSPAIEEALAPLKRLVALANEEHEQLFSQYKTSLAVSKLRAEANEKAVKRDIGNKTDEELLAVLAVDEPEAPNLRRYMTNDTSPASLGEVLRLNRNGLLIHRDELVSLLKGLDREDQAEGRGFYLTGWNGDSSYTIDRIGRGLNLYIEAVCLSLLGGTQPGRVAEYIGQAIKGGTADDGLIQRFGLMVWPDNGPTWKNVDRPPDTRAKNQAFKVYDYLDKMDPAVIGAQLDTDIDGKPEGIPYLRFDPEGLKLFLEWRTDLEARLREGDLHPALESHFAKYRKLIPSLALIIHLSESGGGSVGKRATLKALAWGEYLETHAQRAYTAGAQPSVATAKAILKRIKKGDLGTSFSSRDVSRPKWSMLTDTEKVQDALKLLVEYNHLIEERVETAGRPATVFHLNIGGSR